MTTSGSNVVLTVLVLLTAGVVVAFFGYLYFDDWRRRVRIRRSMRRARQLFEEQSDA